ncbi:DJ-1/PfpI family protein [Allokutzneria sp. A3M-2-11 16]|uniref:DJ-1/PfpI family protein n=1 Tax=Allokutzneria sp. A3M-2-11 16 TaxID=2962043 RepID=UPI0020B683C4|nr:DJ-1/PfpI family protein [Allokutzneria sp. A3M-2-11 16]MCP3803107.1 DJ-1/PfpI family protein [Allokutzneria sp. A3M-2-11 16]
MTKIVAFVLYPGLTPLDLVGPLQTLTTLSAFAPEYRTVVVSERIGSTRTDLPLLLTASDTFEDVPRPHTVVVPGGLGTYRQLANHALLDYVRGAEHAASVCTGSLILGAAGLLEGRRATSHWAVRDTLAAFGAIPVAERWVEDGNVITAAGVSAGIDLALHLAERFAGPEVARHVQLAIEYDPEPPLGPLDWNTVDTTALAEPIRRAMRAELADHPDLLSRLTSGVGSA